MIIDPTRVDNNPWLEVLDWNRFPNFGPVHVIPDKEEFQQNFYNGEEIKNLMICMIETLEEGIKAHNMRLTGAPGAGKTSFAYALKRISEDQTVPLLSKAFIYIFHACRSDDSENNSIYSDEIYTNIRIAWKDYYSLCNQEEQFKKIEERSTHKKQLLNELSAYYRNHKTQFPYTFFFIIDDVDLLPANEVHDIVTVILKELEIASVKKILNIREKTYSNYSKTTKEIISQFFPDHYSYPSISLYELICHRIKNTCTAKNKNQKIPFSKKLCEDTIQRLCEGNQRVGLSILKGFLKDAVPKSYNKATPELQIQKYLEREASKVLVHNIVEDLHSSPFRISSFPLAPDVLALARYHTDERIIFGALGDCINSRNINSEFPFGHNGTEIRIRTPDFNKVVRALLDAGLIRYESKDEHIELTPLGEATAEFAESRKYKEYCMNALGQNESSKYWRLALKDIDYESIYEKFVIWKNSRS